MRVSLCVVTCLAIGFMAPLAQADTGVDIVFVVDESGSMSQEHAWLGPMSASLEAGLIAQGYGVGSVPNRWGLVGFGTVTSPRQINVGGGQFGSAAQFATATGSLLTSGAVEDGYQAINFAMNYGFRGGIQVLIVLVTDEDRDVAVPKDFNAVLSGLNQLGAILNAVVNHGFADATGAPALGVRGLDVNNQQLAFVADGSGGYTTSPGGVATTGHGSTFADYIQLAWQTTDLTGTGVGIAWDLNQLRAGGTTAESFTAAFVDMKIQELEDPFPTITEWGLIALALCLVAGITIKFRPRRAAA